MSTSKNQSTMTTINSKINTVLSDLDTIKFTTNRLYEESEDRKYEKEKSKEFWKEFFSIVWTFGIISSLICGLCFCVGFYKQKEEIKNLEARNAFPISTQYIYKVEDSE